MKIMRLPGWSESPARRGGDGVGNGVGDGVGRHGGASVPQLEDALAVCSRRGRRAPGLSGALPRDTKSTCGRLTPRGAVSEAGPWEATSSRAGAPRWHIVSSHGDPRAPPPRPPSVGTGNGAVCEPGQGPRQTRGLRAPDSGRRPLGEHQASVVPATRPVPTRCSSSPGAGSPSPDILF